MDPRRNPYAPGAGTPPPEFAGRDELIERGVGNTVLLGQIRRDAEARGQVVLLVHSR